MVNDLPDPTPDVPARRPRRLGLWIGLLAIVLALLVAGGALFGVFWAVGNERGTAWLLAHLARIGVGVQVVEPSGALVGDFSARQVVVTAGRTKVVVDDPVWKGLSIAYTAYPGTWARLRAQSLHASRVTITVQPGGTAEPATLPRSLQLPVEIDVTDVAVGELWVPGLTDYPLRDVRGRVHMGLDQGRRHHFDAVSVRAEPLTLMGHGHIDATGDLALDLALDAVQADPAGVTPGQSLPGWASALRRDWQGRLRAKGPLAAFHTSLDVKGRGQSLDASATVEPLSAWPLAMLDLHTDGFDVSALVPRGPMTSLTGNVRIDAIDRAAGAQGGLHIVGNLVNSKPGPWADRQVPARALKIDLGGRIRAAGPIDLTTFEALLSDGRRDAGVLRGTGHWETDRFEVKAQLDQVRPSAVDPALPAMILTGPVTASGTWATGPTGQRATLPSFTAEGQLAGRLLELDRAVQLRLAATGDERRIEVKTFEASAGGARASLSGSAEHADAGWRVLAKATLVDFDPRPWFPGAGNAAWQAGPHRLNLEADTDLSVPDAPTSERTAPWIARLASVRGTARADITSSLLAGIPVTGEVALRHTTALDVLHVDARVDIDGNRLKAAGEITPDALGARDRWSLGAEATAMARLAPVLRLIPGAAESGLLEAMAGTFGLDAEVTGRWPDVVSRGQLQGVGVRAGPLTVNKGDVRWSLGTTGDAPLEVTALVDQAGWGVQQLGATQLTLKGTATSHDFNLRTELKAAPPAWTDGLQRTQPGGVAARTLVLASAQGSLSGGLYARHAGDATPPPIAWKGLLQQLDMRSGQAGAAPWLNTRNVGLEVTGGPSPRFVVAAGRADVFTAGLRWERIEWQPQEGLQTQQLDVQAELEPLPVAPLLARAQPEFGWGGDLRVGGKVVIRQSNQFSANIVLERVNGDLTVTDDGGTQELGLTDLVLSLDVQDGVWTFTQGLAGQQLGVAAGAFVARTSPQRAWPDADAPLQGVFEAQVENLGTWGAWVPTGWRLGGRLRTTASLGGRFGAPEYTGQMVGNGVSARNILEGVNVTDGEVDITLKGDTARIERFTARAGDGTLAMKGDAQFGEAPLARLAVTAEKFELLGRVDRRIVVSGQGDVTLERDNIDVKGRFGVDEGLIDFTRSDAPALGNDVVVSNRTADEPLPAVSTAPQRHRDVSIDLTIGLGDRLRLKGRGIDTGLQGDLKITTPNGLPAFTGSIRAVGGTYAAYGQKLSIDRGVITFNGPVNDPRLDIEATRPDLDVRVGVAITGTALNVRVRLFSDPDMSDIDKLSWLMLGRASDGLGSSDAALLQRAALALLAGDRPGVTEQVLQSIGLDDLSVRQEEGSGQGGQSRDTVVSLGKQLSRRWYVGYERSLNNATGSWQLIYRIARRFTLRAQSGGDENSRDNSLDLIWTWRWD